MKPPPTQPTRPAVVNRWTTALSPLAAPVPRQAPGGCGLGEEHVGALVSPGPGHAPTPALLPDPTLLLEIHEGLQAFPYPRPLRARMPGGTAKTTKQLKGDVVTIATEAAPSVAVEREPNWFKRFVKRNWKAALLAVIVL